MPSSLTGDLRLERVKNLPQTTQLVNGKVGTRVQAFGPQTHLPCCGEGKEQVRKEGEDTKRNKERQKGRKTKASRWRGGRLGAQERGRAQQEGSPHLPGF